MARARLELGEYGTPSVTKQVLRDGKWVTAAEGEKPERWKARVYVRDRDGKIRDVTRYAKSKARAEADLKRAIAKRVSPSPGAELSPSTTVLELGRLWLEGVDAGDLSTGSKATYRATAGRHIVGNKHNAPGPISDMQIAQVSVVAIESALTEVMKSSGPGACESVRKIYRQMFTLAVRGGAIPYNPVSDARMPAKSLHQPEKPRVKRDKKRALTKRERDDLLQFVDQDDYAQYHDMADPIHMMLRTGMRIGEVMAAKWEGLDLKARAFKVESTWAKEGNSYVVQDFPKRGDAGASRRTVPLHKDLVKRLQARPRDSEFIFPSETGGLRDHSNVNTRLRSILDRAGLEWATSHTFRRTVATLLDLEGVSPRVVANLLGHVRPSMTQDVYMKRTKVDPKVADLL